MGRGSTATCLPSPIVFGFRPAGGRPARYGTMTTRLGFYGLLLGIALAPAACDSDDDDGGGATGGTGNVSAAGRAGHSNAGDGTIDAAGSGGTSSAGTTAKGGRGGGGAAGANAGRPNHGAAGDDGNVGEGGTSIMAGGDSQGGASNGGEPALGGASGEAGAGPVVHLEIDGTWGNADYGEMDVIDDTTWSADYGAGPSIGTIASFSNDDNRLIRRAPADATYNPLKYDVIAWTEIDGNHFYYCTVAFGIETLGEAESDTTPYDASDPENGGCGSFPWTKLTRQ